MRRPRRRQMPTAAVASVCTERSQIIQRSRATDWSPRAVAAPLQMPLSSASAELRATVDWVEDQCFIRWVPLKERPPDVDLRVSMHPATSVSTMVRRWLHGGWCMNCQTRRGRKSKYLTSLRSASTAAWVGELKQRHSSLVAYAMSGRTRAR